MEKELMLVEAFHRKFKVPVGEKPSSIPRDRSALRYRLMREEVREYAQGVKERDVENIAKELADILYAVYGTILEHGLQKHMERVFAEVHRSHMTKEYHAYKMKKGATYVEPNLKKIFRIKR